MKKIDEWTDRTVNAGRVGIHSNNNTIVRITEGGACRVSLFGNIIYCIGDDGAHYFTLAGYNTVTTRARLNALLWRFNMRIYCRGGVAYLEGASFTARPLDTCARYKINAGDVVKI